jgi:hypothetical protein
MRCQAGLISFAMKYFFDVHNGSVDIDHDGIELESISAAVHEARSTLASIASETILAGENLVRIDVRDGERLLCCATMSIDVRHA